MVCMTIFLSMDCEADEPGALGQKSPVGSLVKGLGDESPKQNEKLVHNY